MIRLRHFIILGLLAVACWLITANERALGIDKAALVPVGCLPLPAREPSPRRGECLGGCVLLASLVGMSIIMTWLWFVVRAAG